MEVIWKPPLWGWIKINCDGASLGNLGPYSCDGIARDFDEMFLGAFASFIGVFNSLIFELTSAMLAIKFAHEKG